MSCCPSCCWCGPKYDDDSDQDTLARPLVTSTTRAKPIVIPPSDFLISQNGSTAGNTFQLKENKQEEEKPNYGSRTSGGQKYYVQFEFDTLKKGEEVEEVDNVADSEAWVYVRDADGQIIKAPTTFLAKIRDLEDEPWYFLNIKSRNQAELILRNADPEDGIYLIRKSEKDSIQYVLSVKREVQSQDNDANEEKRFEIKHYIISERNGLFGEEGKEKFVTLSSMMDKYIEINHISRPCPKELVINIEPSEIVQNEELGRGNFGVVYKGTWAKQTVAIKQITSTTDLKDEIKQLCQFNHPQIVTIYGANIQTAPFFMVMEYMCNDTLKNYVHNHDLELSVQLYILEQIADGMKYLEKYKVLHRDLAARNVLVGEKNCVKIADFGLSRNLPQDDIYYRTDGNVKLPLLWLAPECLKFHKFSVKSDVWMFGILAMEIFTRGKKPYSDINMNSQDIATEIINNGLRMDRPDNMPIDVYKIVRDCWEEQTKNRPSFLNLFEYFMEIRKKSVGK